MAASGGDGAADVATFCSRTVCVIASGFPRRMAAPEIVDHGFKIALDEISVAEGSGWRPSQDGVVKRFVNEFPANYGTGIHRVPRVLVKEKRQSPNTDVGPVFVEDAVGKALLDDGKSTIQALGALAKKLQEGKLLESACCPRLLEVLRAKMLVVQLVLHESDDVLERVAHNANAHDEENSNYLPTTLSQKIKLVMQVKQAVEENGQKWSSGSWSGTGKCAACPSTIAGT